MMTAVKGVHATVWIHHIMGVYGSGAMRHFRIAAYLPEVFFPTEITVVPTNLLSHLDGMFPTSAAAASAAKGKANRGPAERTVISGALDPRVVFHIRTVLLVVRCASYLEEQTLALGDERPAPRPLTGWKLYARLWKRYWALPPIVSVLSALNMMTLGAFNVWWTVLVFKALARHLRSGRNVGTGVHHI
ncbi:hypothetical protein DFJ73DRAFT_862495 [Zopfochytrium polystomum]|nr:hypothetical protein DFJ73DRAFT_862495 [Zopfochytrium polystomum]